MSTASQEDHACTNSHCILLSLPNVLLTQCTLYLALNDRYTLLPVHRQLLTSLTTTTSLRTYFASISCTSQRVDTVDRIFIRRGQDQITTYPSMILPYIKRLVHSEKKEEIHIWQWDKTMSLVNGQTQQKSVQAYQQQIERCPNVTEYHATQATLPYALTIQQETPSTTNENQWQLQSLFLTTPYLIPSFRNWIKIPISFWSPSTLHTLSIRNVIEQEDRPGHILSALLWSIAAAELHSLETLRLEQGDLNAPWVQEFDKEITTPEMWRSLSDEQPLINYSLYSKPASQIIEKVFMNSPLLTSLHLGFFHPMNILPHHALLPHLSSFHWVGLLTFESLPHLARLNTVKSLVLDFYVDVSELQEKWQGDWNEEPIIESIQTDENNLAVASTVPATHQPPTKTTSSVTPDVSFYLFNALSKWYELRTLQLQSTQKSINFCLVDWKNFTLLQSLTHLFRLQFSFFSPETHEVDISYELDRLCQTIPSLTEVILNVERNEYEEEDDSNDEADEEPIPTATSTLPQITPIIPLQLKRLTPSKSLCKLKKIGVWDGMAKPIGATPYGTSELGLSNAHCILMNLAPFLTIHPNLHSLSLIFAQVSTFQPLHLIADSLVSLCLYFSHTPKRQPNLADDDTDLDPNITALSHLHQLGWLIMHGSGSSDTSLTGLQLIQLGHVVDGHLHKLRNWRLEHQPEMNETVWDAWMKPFEGKPALFPHLSSLSFKDCTNMGDAGLTRVLDDIAASFTEPTETRLLPALVDLNLVHCTATTNFTHPLISAAASPKSRYIYVRLHSTDDTSAPI